jgi:hypothetical protein
MQTRYINQSGNVSHKRRFQLQDFSLTRMLVLMLVISTLFITNPSNEIVSSTSKRKSPLYNGAWSNLKATFSKQKEAYTNFGICSFSKSSDGVSMWILNQKVQICHNYGEFPELCHWMSRNICHGMKLSDSRPFTVLRIIQSLKLMSFLLDSCYSYGTLVPAASASNIMNSLFSVLYQPMLLSDMIELYNFVYPAFELMERICFSGTNTASEASLHFYTLVLLFFFTGAISNTMGNYLTNESVRGMIGTIAACLGYISAAKPSKVILELGLGMPLTAGDILFGTSALTFALNIFGFRPLLGKWCMAMCIAWAVGGLLGHIVADRQIWFYKLWWWSF